MSHRPRRACFTTTPMPASDAPVPNMVPPVVPWLQNGFHRFLRPFLRRHFHSVAVTRGTREQFSMGAHEPVIVFGNHPGWWDPLIAHFVNRTLFAPRQFYAPIDAAALEHYGVFKKLGFYGVQMNSSRGAAAFLKQSTAILHTDATALWLTPEGRFADVRDHSAPLMPGLSHLCHRLSTGYVIPLALEYVFWDERLPECLVHAGQRIKLTAHADLAKPQWDTLLNETLRGTQEKLAELAKARSSAPFENLLPGKAGAGGFYDSLRRVQSLISGRPIKSSHGDQFR